MRVLVVSDAPDACATMCGAISQPVLAERAIDGGSALTMIEAAISGGRPFDLVATAMALRDMDGFLLLKRVREAERRAGVAVRTPLWLLTATEAGRGIVETHPGTFDAHVHLPDQADATTPPITRDPAAPYGTMGSRLGNAATRIGSDREVSAC